ncbi:Matrixin [Pseudobythopirellula maris]|uniref:Matrixin n=1 Tax=Pseudobythopirellula maris TaxID=2527991 RepID=A0A5C5ZLK2_9BACT|nr:matrixin family metalloprotease [Pseudobythopirellula maris]TWT88334.1 Matrixin [Pseudobythopirellula maris]
MPPYRRVRSLTIAATLLAASASGGAHAFVPGDRWTSTSSGSAGDSGEAISLTWSLVPDGTLIPDDGYGSKNSNLIATLDTLFDVEAGAGMSGADLMTRPWFEYFDRSFSRWSELTGVTYTYEANDDGLTSRLGFLSGFPGLRGDVRIGGAFLDGVSNEDGDVLAYNYFPNNADMVIDTGDPSLFTTAENDHRLLRNVIMHEAGHGLGLEHSSSFGDDFLMEPSINVDFDGPQHDDLRGVHWFYGDALEKGGGNGSTSTATPLGALTAGATLAVGLDGDGVAVDESETDFVSIANQFDDDYFAFTVAAATTLNLVATPLGAEFDQTGQPFNTRETSDLRLAFYGPGGGSPIAESVAAGSGEAESLTGISISEPGEYYARVWAEDNTNSSSEIDIVQFYQLAITDLSTPSPALPGDYNGNGVVDAADFTVWRDTRDTAVANAYEGADGDGDGLIGPGDYTVWVNHFGQTLPAPGLSAPEPGAFSLLALGGSLFFARRRTARG